MVLVTVQTFNEPYEANICKAQLEAEGINCFIKNETAIAANPLMVGALGGYQLQCQVVDMQRALEIIA